MATQEVFEHEPVSHAVAHYLVTVSALLEEYGYARVSDVARRIGITRGSASITLKSLRQKGLVTEDGRRFLGLSDTGRQIAESVLAKRRIMRDLMVRVLGVSPEQAEKDTCEIEHLLSAETAERAKLLLDFVDSDSKASREFQSNIARFEKKRI
jgi:DtxR family Mn-dependent transcriptional regulator